MLALLTVTHLLRILFLSNQEKENLIMKAWNTPELMELNFNETANGRSEWNKEAGSAWKPIEEVVPPVNEPS